MTICGLLLLTSTSDSVRMGVSSGMLEPLQAKAVQQCTGHIAILEKIQAFFNSPIPEFSCMHTRHASRHAACTVCVSSILNYENLTKLMALYMDA